MTAAWPGTLPQRFLIPGNSESLDENRIASQTDTGPGKRRPRSSMEIGSFTGTMRMSGAQWAILLAFGKTDLGKWVLPFTIPATDGGADWLVRFAMGSKPRRVNIGGDRWNVSMALEILP